MVVLYVSSYFYRNKQNSYAALNLHCNCDKLGGGGGGSSNKKCSCSNQLVSSSGDAGAKQ